MTVDLTVPHDCPRRGRADSKDLLLDATDAVANGMGNACCPHHAVLAAVLLCYQLSETSAMQGDPSILKEEIQRVAEAYAETFKVSPRHTAVHLTAYLLAISMAMATGRIPGDPSEVAA